MIKFRELSWVEHVVTRSLTLREESRLRVFENKILGRIFGPTWDENVEWRRLHKKKIYSSHNWVWAIKFRRLK